MDTKERQITDLVPEFKNRLSSHGLDTTKLDDTQWGEVVTEIQPLFAQYENGYNEGGGTFQR